jgi:hypothetical protein
MHGGILSFHIERAEYRCHTSGSTSLERQSNFCQVEAIIPNLRSNSGVSVQHECVPVRNTSHPVASVHFFAVQVAVYQSYGSGEVGNGLGCD